MIGSTLRSRDRRSSVSPLRRGAFWCFGCPCGGSRSNMSGLATRGLRAFQQLSQRSFSTAARRGVVNRVPEKQKIFQEDNGIPVHLKGGVVDAVLYRLTMALTAGGTVYVLYQLFDIAFPRKK